MSKKILQINAQTTIPASELAEEFMGVATPISEVAGLEWKIFGMNDERGEAVGIYLFEDAGSLQAYVDGPITAAMKTKPAFGEIQIKVFDIAEAASRVTRGPI